MKLCAAILLVLAGCGDDTVPGPPDANPDAPIDGPEIDAAAIPDGGCDDAAPVGAMAPIAPGGFMMGCNQAVDTDCTSDEYPYHPVILPAFDIDRREVTQAEYQACIDATACDLPAANFDPQVHPNWPVRDVSWMQAQTYCTYAGKRLPTEAEWEKAARDIDGRIYPWGNTAPDCAHANFDGCGGLDDTGARTAGLSPCGVFDLAGNVWEWVADWYDSGYYQVSPTVSPPGPASGSLRVARGGSFQTPSYAVRTSKRISGDPTIPYDDIGIRCAR